jgi:ligand-binding SRPBCC domain-containing protein
MPRFQTTTTLGRPPAAVFEFLCDPANLVAVTPPEFNMHLVEGPGRLEIGSRVVLQGRRWGFSQRVVNRIVTLEPNRLLVDEQLEGLFKKWIHSHRLEEMDGGTRMIDEVEWEPPGGMLGLLLNGDTIQA